MAPTPLKKLTNVQQSRFEEIQQLSSRLREKERSSFNYAIVSSRIKTLNDIWSNARATHEDIVSREDSTDSAYITDRFYSQMQTLYEDTTDFLLTLQAEIEAANPRPAPNGSQNDSSLSDIQLRTAKLPKLELPTFTGRYEDWENFCDLFTTLVHDAPQIADATKLQYLKSCLKGTAADLVKDVATTNANYPTTWQALKTRFHNPRLIVFNHLKAFMDIPHLKKESATAIRSFTDEAQRIVRALTNLKMPVEHWDIWFVYVLTTRLDPESRKAWETKMSVKDHNIISNPDPNLSEANPLSRFPKFADLAVFLENRARTLSMLSSEEKTEKKVDTTSRSIPGARKVFHSSLPQDSSDDRVQCPLCSGAHRLHKCYEFKAKNAQERRSDVQRLRLCYNCLGTHKVAECQSPFRCQQCKQKHHTLIHFSSINKGQEDADTSDEQEKAKHTSKPRNVLTASLAPREQSVILATAQILLIGPHGERTQARALLDQGSESSFISSHLAKLLNLPTQPVVVPLNGVGGGVAGTARLSTQFKICSLVKPDFQFTTNALILPRLTSHLPARRSLELDIELLSEFVLADPLFYIPDSIDVILGADIYGQLLRPGLRRLPIPSLIAQETVLGWIVSGAIQSECSGRADSGVQPPIQVLHCNSDENLDKMLQKFWVLENIPDPVSKLSPEEEACEKLFESTHSRDAEGRFVVRLPFRAEPPPVGLETRSMALNSLASLHRRFNRDPKLASEYKKFMTAYEDLGHMERVPRSEVNKSRAWYLAHHAVVQSSPTNWKLRVVFDASRRTRDHKCLNEFLMPGPSLQRDLSLILLNWRRYRYVFTADIVKMFRQIGVALEDRDTQRIVWAPNPSMDPVDYRLTTVTYGTSCAPYLAIRTLAKLAETERSRFPLGSECLDNNTYVDDTFAGADELAVAIRIRTELTELLRTAGIELSKWAANHHDLLPQQALEDEPAKPKMLLPEYSVKTLGINWNPSQDEFHFSTPSFEELSGASTKRTIFSKISQLFDPLGWLTPVTVTAKVLMQDLWLSKSGWDTPLPAEIRERWLEYCRSLPELSHVTIGRWLRSSTNTTMQIHAFADASCRAYAAAVYLRVEEEDGTVRVSLLAAKSKVAPVKRVSIPNLELCGAALLVKLVGNLRKLNMLRHLPVFAWSDSQIVLTWLRKHPCYWKTFVANRVSYIQTELPTAVWSHVSTKENPADLATRGCHPTDLAQSDLWWHGPDWLMKDKESWPQVTQTARVLHTRSSPDEPEILTRYSSLTRLIRIVARCLRWPNIVKRRRNKLEEFPDFLTGSEITDARNALIQLAQAHAFSSELALLKTKSALPKRSPLRALNPILDKTNSIILVGGRLSNSNLPERQKHPPILPRNSALSRLFVHYAHRMCLHGGPTLTSSTVIRYAWILGRNRLVKTECRSCITCQRHNPQLAHQMMGDLPSARVNPARPFTNAGLDYAGPFQIRFSAGRGNKSCKGYIALFVCFSTRAIHLEAVGDLKTRSFLAAYKRFIGRRGVCKNLYSDNATTFHAADKELKSMFSKASEFYKESAASLANDGTSWTFIPPNSPHYGGLWEAGVKSVKYHLKRSFGEKLLTYEEFSTVLVEIEACLNSRPLCPLKSDVDDLRALTPMNFLIGEESAQVPDMEPPDVPENRLERFHIMQRIRNNFWDRWSKEYMQHLQERNKWREPTEMFGIGQLVLLRDDRYPPAKWPLGRVVEVHPGPDGLVRVVSVRTASSTLRRHIARLCPLTVRE